MTKIIGILKIFIGPFLLAVAFWVLHGLLPGTHYFDGKYSVIAETIIQETSGSSQQWRHVSFTPVPPVAATWSEDERKVFRWARLKASLCYLLLKNTWR